jgi:hypothetical protein
MTLTDPIELKSLMMEVEAERERLQKWWSQSSKDCEHESMYLYRTKRLSIIRENLKLLAESYED